MTAADFKVSSEIHELKARQCPRQLGEFALAKEQRNDPAVVLILAQCKQQFMLDPFRTDGVWGQHHDEPVASLEGMTNLVVPLLRTSDMRLAVPVSDAFAVEKLCKLEDKSAIAAGMREENFLRSFSTGH